MGDLATSLASHRGVDPRHQLLDEDGEPLADVHPPPPTDEELSRHHVAPGEPHLVDCGVHYQGEWRQHGDGMSWAVRQQALALAQFCPLQLHHVSQMMMMDDELHPDVRREVGHLPRIMFRDTLVSVRQFIFHTPHYLRSILMPAGGRNVDPERRDRILQSTIVYTSWERNAVDRGLVEKLQEVGELWVPCEANRTAFVDSGMASSKVHVVPHAYDPATHPTTQFCWPRGSDAAPDGRRFYNIGKWEPRKNQHGLLGAFFLAFTPAEKVSLFIKTHGFGDWMDYPTPEESMRHWLDDSRVRANGWTAELARQRVRVLLSKITDSEIADIHRKNDVYVSASHGEAWDIPAFDALCAGNALVHVGYGGSADYAKHSLAPVERVSWMLGPVHEGYEWEPSAKWAQYDESDLVAALRRVRAPNRRIHPAGFKEYSRAHVGRLMFERILERVTAVGGSRMARKLELAGAFG